MSIVRQTSITGAYVHPATDLHYSYEVHCRVAVDRQGRESMHLQVQVSRGNASTGFVVLGHVDPEQSFIGREEQVAMECVALACARVSAPGQQLPHAGLTRPAPTPMRRGTLARAMTIDLLAARRATA